MTDEEKNCIKELNGWYNSKQWPKKVKRNVLPANPFLYLHNKIHCYCSVMLNSIGLTNDINEKEKYTNYLLKVISPILLKYNIREMGYGFYIVKYKNNKWIRNKNESYSS